MWVTMVGVDSQLGQSIKKKNNEIEKQIPINS